MKVPLIDLKAQFLSLKPEIEIALKKVLNTSAFILGKEVFAFEKEFAEYCGTKYCLGVNSGTSALHLALLVNDIGAGDEVITQPNTFFATCEAISYTGAKPVFVDIDPQTHTLDVKKIPVVITSKTKAIVPVHVYGQATEMTKIKQIAKKHNLIVIEDAAQAHGVMYKNKKLGSFAQAGCFSFYPGKVLGAYGEAGAMITNSKKIYEKAKALRDHGLTKDDYHKFVGYNYRMDGFQGAILRIKLRKLNQWILKRRQKAKLYSRLLKKVNQVIAPQDNLDTSNFQYYVIRCKDRDRLKQYLNKNNVFAKPHYSIPAHLQEAYQSLGYKKGDFPVAEKYAKEILSLPMYPELTKKQIEYVVGLIKKFYSHGKAN